MHLHSFHKLNIPQTYVQRMEKRSLVVGQEICISKEVTMTEHVFFWGKVLPDSSEFHWSCSEEIGVIQSESRWDRIN
jgi:hypothetical protein